MRAILRKELADYFTSIRFIILFILVIGVSAAGLFAASQGIRGANLPEGFVFLGLFTSLGSYLPTILYLLFGILFFSILVPIIGISLGFDAINSERSGGTLSRLLSQPVYRDSVINGKFLAGVFALAVMIGTALLLVSGYGLSMIGVPPTAEEIIRLFIFFVLTIIYGAFWMGIAIMFSVILKRMASSLLISLAVWLFFTVFMLMIAPAIANAMAPLTQGSTEMEIIRNREIQQIISYFSPHMLYFMAINALLLPVAVGSLGAVTTSQMAYMIPNPLGLGQSLLLIWPHITSLVSLSAICFAISYVLFMKQEIRAT